MRVGYRDDDRLLAVGVAILAAGIDRQFQLRSIQGPLDAEAVVRGQSLRDTLDRYRIVSVPAARGAVVRQNVAGDRPDERPTARLQALTAMSNLRGGLR